MSSIDAAARSTELVYSDVRRFGDEPPRRAAGKQMPAVRIEEAGPPVRPTLDRVCDHDGGHGAVGHAPAVKAGGDVKLTALSGLLCVGVQPTGLTAQPPFELRVDDAVTRCQLAG